MAKKDLSATAQYPHFPDADPVELIEGAQKVVKKAAKFGKKVVEVAVAQETAETLRKVGKKVLGIDDD